MVRGETAQRRRSFHLAALAIALAALVAACATDNQNGSGLRPYNTTFGKGNAWRK